jgi:hypothetical protein
MTFVRLPFRYSHVHSDEALTTLAREQMIPFVDSSEDNNRTHVRSDQNTSTLRYLSSVIH